MKIDFLLEMDRKAREAGTRNPDDVLEYMGYIPIDPGKACDGFFMYRKTFIYYGVNCQFTGMKRSFGIMHEGFHGLCRHYKTPGFLTNDGMHLDNKDFSTYKTVAGTERDANIGAADFIIDTQTCLQMMGYEKADVQCYRRDVESFETHLKQYQEHLDHVRFNGSSEARLNRMLSYQQELERMYRELQEQAQDISNSGICTSKYEIAREFGVPEFIIDYKFEALKIRNYDVATMELPSFEKVFSKWR